MRKTNFWRDYWTLTKQSAGFCKKHWLGMIILSFVTGMGTYLFTGGGESIKDKIEDLRR